MSVKMAWILGYLKVNLAKLNNELRWRLSIRLIPPKLSLDWFGFQIPGHHAEVFLNHRLRVTEDRIRGGVGGGGCWVSTCYRQRTMRLLFWFVYPLMTFHLVRHDVFSFFFVPGCDHMVLKFKVLFYSWCKMLMDKLWTLNGYQNVSRYK